MEESGKTNTHGSTASSQATTMQVSPDPIFQMVTGFWVSKTLMTAVELEVFTELSGNKYSVNLYVQNAADYHPRSRR